MAVGEEVSAGDIVGVVQETPIIQHKIMVPFGVSGTIAEIKAGDFAIDETVYSVETAKGTESFSMMQNGPFGGTSHFRKTKSQSTDGDRTTRN